MSDHAGQKYSAEKLFLVQVLNYLETLGNLNHLVNADAEDAQTVRSYLKQSEEILPQLAALVYSRSSHAA
jgi:hypothetical protein